ncbi:MAG: carboxylesterase NlhH [Pseudomonadota bacterium]|jgi:acetyl esterase
MQFDPFIKALFDQLPQLANLQVWQLTPRQARAEFKKLCTLANQNAAPIGKVENVEATGTENPIPIRVYTPVAAGSSALPALAYFHGGGFVLGDIDCYDPLCRTLANESGCRVLSVDYRLAPEHPFPAAVEDCFAALKWIEANSSVLGIDPNRIGVAGDSAGGNLAAVVAQLAKSKGGPHLAFQLLIYPMTSLHQDAPSAFGFGGNVLTQPAVSWFYKQYVSDDVEPGDPRLSPLQATDFSGLPPAYVVTAGFDPLRDEGAAYAAKLKAAGVKVRHIDYPTMIHGFFSMQDLIPMASEAVAAAGQAARDALA